MNSGLLVLSMPAAWLMGLGASVHCALMCLGPNSLPATLQGHAGHRAAWSMHAGRLSGYVGLGALAGELGTLLLRHLPSGEHAQWLRVGVGVVLAVAGLWMLWRRPVRRANGCPMHGQRGRQQHWYVQGMAWAVTPCPTLYAMLLVAAISGSAWQGASLMLAFGLGTAPLLMGQHLALMRWLPRQHVQRWRALGLLLAGGALAVSGVAASFGPGLFCLRPV